MVSSEALGVASCNERLDCEKYRHFKAIFVLLIGMV